MKSAISSLTSGIMHQISYRLSRKGSHYLVSASLDVKSAQKHILKKKLNMLKIFTLKFLKFLDLIF